MMTKKKDKAQKEQLEISRQQLACAEEQLKVSRRAFMVTGAAGIVAALPAVIPLLKAVISLFPGKNTIGAIPNLGDVSVEAASMDLLSALVSIDDDPMKLYAGKTNILRKAGGKDGLSSYLSNASSAFLSYIRRGTGYEIERCDPDSELLTYDTTRSFLMLGGPVANQEAARFADYTYRTVADRTTGKEVKLPLFDSNRSRYRWGFFCGDNGYGFLNGKELKAKRYEDGESVERPHYGILDTKKHGMAPILYEKDVDGFLREEALVIIKRPNPKNPDKKSIAIVGGVHGYSTEAFARDLNDSLTKLRDVISDSPYYQVYVPVILEHNHQDRVTIGRLDWDRVEKHRFE